MRTFTSWLCVSFALIPGLTPAQEDSPASSEVRFRLEEAEGAPFSEAAMCQGTYRVIEWRRLHLEGDHQPPVGARVLRAGEPLPAGASFLALLPGTEEVDLCVTLTQRPSGEDHLYFKAAVPDRWTVFGGAHGDFSSEEVRWTWLDPERPLHIGDRMPVLIAQDREDPEIPPESVNLDVEALAAEFHPRLVVYLEPISPEALGTIYDPTNGTTSTVGAVHVRQ